MRKDQKNLWVIEDLKSYAHIKGGRLLTSKYYGVAFRYRFVCSEGHVFETQWSNMVRTNSWCGKCSAKRRSENMEADKYLPFVSKTVQEGKKIINNARYKEISDYAKNKNGKLLTEKYMGVEAKYKFECKYGHQWSAKWSRMKYGENWCLECFHGRKSKYSIKDLKDYAYSMGGECLSSEFKKLTHKYKFRCSQGHEFESIWNSMRVRKSWCKICSMENNLTTKYSISDLVHYARQKGGECLSTEYLKYHDKYEFRCKRGHYFKKSWKSLNNDKTWCPHAQCRWEKNNKKGIFQKIKSILKNIFNSKKAR